MKTQVKALILLFIAVFITLVATTQTNAQPATVAATPRPTHAPSTIIVEVTEQQFIKAVGNTRFFLDQKKLTLDVIEGQLVIVIDVDSTDIPLVLFRFGASVEKNRVPVRVGFIEANGITGPIDQVLQAVPSFTRDINRMNTILSNTVRNQIARKVGGRYTIQSAVFTQDKLVITILK